MYTENEARDLFVTLVSTISYVHSKNVVHRDLKVSEQSQEAAAVVVVVVLNM